MIKLADLVDLENIMECYSKSIAKMHELNIFQWDDNYPNKTQIEEDIKRGQFYVYKTDNDQIQGVICLNTDEHPTYKTIKWSFEGKALVVHRLAINPDFQGKGIAKLLMQFTENKAKEFGYNGVRLDTFVENKIAINFYLKLGYAQLETVSFKNRIYYCFDKELITIPPN